MAEEQEESATPNKKGKKKKLILLLVLILLVAGGGGGAWLKMSKSDAPEKPKIPQYMVLDPFLISLSSQSRPHYLQLKLSLMGRDKEMLKTLESYRPMIRNQIIRYLGTLTYEDVRKDSSSDVIRKKTFDQVVLLLEQEKVAVNLEDLIITEIVLQ